MGAVPVAVVTAGRAGVAETAAAWLVAVKAVALEGLAAKAAEAAPRVGEAAMEAPVGG